MAGFSIEATRPSAADIAALAGAQARHADVSQRRAQSAGGGVRLPLRSRSAPRDLSRCRTSRCAISQARGARRFSGAAQRRGRRRDRSRHRRRPQRERALPLRPGCHRLRRAASARHPHHRDRRISRKAIRASATMSCNARLTDKIAAAEAAGLAGRDRHPVLLRRAARSSISSRACARFGFDHRVRVGLVGPTSLTSLMRYASRCGVRASAQALARRAGPDAADVRHGDAGRSGAHARRRRAGRRRPAFLFVRRRARDRTLGARGRRRPDHARRQRGFQVTPPGGECRRADKSRSQNAAIGHYVFARHDPKQPDHRYFLPRHASGRLQLPNRIVMAPMTRNRAGPGEVPGPIAATYYAQRASAGPDRHRRHADFAAGPGLCRHARHIQRPSRSPAGSAVTDAVHAAGGRIFLQLWHVGRISHPSLQPSGGAPVAPSALQAGRTRP